MKNQTPRRRSCAGCESESTASSQSEECRLDQSPEEIKFLETLPYAETLSIRLLEFHSTRNYMQGVFQLELKATTRNNVETKYELEMDGISDPKSCWPRFTFEVPEKQKHFLIQSLLPALQSGVTKQMKLRSLIIQGCGRVSGFYTSLMKILFQNDVSAPPKALSILHWTDFCNNVDWDVAQKALLLELNQLNIEYGPKMELDTFERLCHGLSPKLERLYLKTGVFEDSQSWSQWRSTFERLTELKELTWVTHDDDRCEKIHPRSPETRAILQDLCKLWRSLSLRKLDLGLNYLDETLLDLLLFEDKCNLPIEHLSLTVMNDSCGSVVGRFIQSNHNLCHLRLSLPYQGYDEKTTGLKLVLEQSKNHPALQQLELNNMSSASLEDDEVTSMMTCLLSAEDSILRDFSIKLRSSISHEDLIQQAIELGMEKEEKALSLQTLYQSIFAGLRDNNGTLRSLRLENCEVDLDDNSCKVLHEALLSNPSIINMDLGKCRILENVFSKLVVREVGRNLKLKQLNGMDFVDDANQESLNSILQINKNLVQVSPLQEQALSNNGKAADFYLKLNQAGRKHWIDSDFSSALMPYLLSSVSSDPSLLCYILRSKTELIPHKL